MTPYRPDIRRNFTTSFNLSRSALATTLVFSVACIFTVEVHANPMWEFADPRGADQSACVQRIIPWGCSRCESAGTAATRDGSWPRPGAPREAPSESSARWGDSATRNPDTPPPIGPPAARRSRRMADAGGSLEHRGDRSRTPIGHVRSPPGLRRSPALAPHCDDRAGRRRENGRLAPARHAARSPNRARRHRSSSRRRSRSPRPPTRAYPTG